MSEFKIGSKVKVVNRGRVFEGALVKIIDPYEALSSEELLEYANLREGDRDYDSVRGASCSVQRLVLKAEDSDGFWIVPVKSAVR